MSAVPIRVSLSNDRGYSLFQRPLESVPDLLRDHDLNGNKCLVVTDLNVGALYADCVQDVLRSAGFAVRIVTLPPGEETKSHRYLQEIYDAALAWRIDRETPVLALGGGVVGDVAGFAAATLLRGLPLVQLPTSLLAQVDSAIGGKTGINHDAGKNLIGAFYQPRFVCADPETLKTLPDKEWTSGMAEVLKHGLLDQGLFAWLSPKIDAIVNRASDSITEMIAHASRIKANIVSADEHEAGQRAHLNLGHTFGHALEKVAGYGSVTHGEAVLIGLKAAVFLSARRYPNSDFSAASNLLASLPTPTLSPQISVADLQNAMLSDKKIKRGTLRLVLLRNIGDPFVTDDVENTDLAAAWESALPVRD